MEILSSIGEFIDKLFSAPEGILSYLTFIIRILLPVLAVVITVRVIKSYCRSKEEKEIWGKLTLSNGASIPLYHWENLIGRGRSSDVLIEIPTVSRVHAAIIRDSKGDWVVHDLNSKGGVYVNGETVERKAEVETGDKISLGGVDMVFFSQTLDEEREQARARTRPGREIRPSGTLFLLMYFQILLGVQLCIAMPEEHIFKIGVSFFALIIIMWLYFIVIRSMRRTGVEVETIAFFLSTVGLSVTATSDPEGLFKHIFFIIAGVILLFVLGFFLRSLDRAKKVRLPAAIFGILFLAVNLVIAQATNGAKNWITIGGFTFQPSEFVKLCFIFVGAATLDRLFARRNLIVFIGFAGACVGALALMSDFGTALIFFVTYMVIAFLRSGSFATILLSVGGAGFAGFLVLMMKPYILSRFSTWGKAWEFVNDAGYQQTRTMTAMASGGLFGNGAGKGWLKYVFAADTDMVFGRVSEELGLIIGLCCIAALVALVIFAIKSASSGRSSFYVIGACAAASMLLFQMTLNTFGALDILPFTGVTFPFVSRGGSSLISCWGILAFIKAADTRQNASFAIKLPKGIRKAAKQPVLENEQQNDNEYVENYGNLNDFESFGSLEVFDDNYDDYED